MISPPFVNSSILTLFAGSSLQLSCNTRRVFGAALIPRGTPNHESSRIPHSARLLTTGPCRIFGSIRICPRSAGVQLPNQSCSVPVLLCFKICASPANLMTTQNISDSEIPPAKARRAPSSDNNFLCGLCVSLLREIFRIFGCGFCRAVSLRSHEPPQSRTQTLYSRMASYIASGARSAPFGH